MDKQTENDFIAQATRLISVAQFFLTAGERGGDAVRALTCVALPLHELLPPRRPDGGERIAGAEVVDFSVYRDRRAA